MDRPNIYSTVVFELHPKIKEFLDRLNGEGQIDLDEHGYPYLVGVQRNGPNFQVFISRNNKLENFLLNPRKKVEPLTSWNPGDEFVRASSPKTTVQMDSVGAEDKPRGERQRRTVEAYERIVNQILSSEK